jgi:ABC-type uncharacterized transport system permease subunit
LADLLFWPALLAYGEAAVAYAGVLRRPEIATRLAIWGVRLGWLAQTALLVVQASRAEGFPWTSWAAALNLFVWLVVGVYLIWGCRPRYRLLGLAVMPAAAALFALAGAAGGIGSGTDERYSTLFLALHVGLLLAGFAGLALAAALAGLYLWQERRLKGRSAGLVRLGAPALVTVEALVGRTVAVSFPALTLGIAVGLARARELDATIAVTLLAWVVYAVFLALRFRAGWRGRRAAYLVLAAFALVVAAGVGLPVVHGG